MSCEIDSADIYDPPFAFQSKDRKAKKNHQCGECGREIKVGETYRYESGVWDDGPDSHKTCMDCISVRDAFFCSFIFGQVWDDIRELVFDYDGELSGKKLLSLTPAARAKVCDLIDDLEVEEG